MSFPADVPSHLLRYLAKMHLDGIRPAWVRLAEDGVRIAEVGGDWSLYRSVPPVPGELAEELHVSMMGIFPLEEDFRISQVEEQGRFFDIDALHHAGRWWVMFTEVTQVTRRLQQMQQATNSMLLKYERQQQLLERHVGDVVTSRMLDGDLELYRDGQRLHICTMFMDIRSFTVFNESHDAQEVLRTVNQYLDVMLDSVLRYDGHVDKITGDGAMVVFGLHASSSPCEQQAFDSALLLMQGIAELQEKREEKGEKPLGVGVGIASGEAVVGLVGTHQRRTFTAFGRHVNLAARLESHARAGSILLDTPTHHALRTYRGCVFESRILHARGIGTLEAWEARPVFQDSVGVGSVSS